MSSHSNRKPAIFLDRDGVLCKEKSYVTNVNDIEIFDYSKDCIEEIKKKGYYTIVITNQSGVARGLFSEIDLQCINIYLQKETGVDAIYYCPHHPEGIVGKYKVRCECRKPGTQLLRRAQGDFCIDMEHSYMVGDRASDIQTGKNAGIKTILLESGYGTKCLEQDVTPDYVRDDLRGILELI